MKLPWRPAMSPQRCIVAVVMLVQTTLLAMLLAGHEPWSGPVVMKLTGSHGLHLSDIPLIVLWAIGMLCCGALWVSPRP